MTAVSLLTPTGAINPATVLQLAHRLEPQFLANNAGMTVERARERSTEYAWNAARGQRRTFVARQAEARRVERLPAHARRRELYEELSRSFSTDPHQDRLVWLPIRQEIAAELERLRVEVEAEHLSMSEAA